MPLSNISEIRGSNLCDGNHRVYGETRITKVDGKSASSFSSGYQRDLQIKPGTHGITVYWFYGGLRTENKVTLPLEAKAGHRYIVRANTDYAKKVSFGIEDQGPNSTVKPFQPMKENGEPSNCY